MNLLLWSRIVREFCWPSSQSVRDARRGVLSAFARPFRDDPLTILVMSAVGVVLVAMLGFALYLRAISPWIFEKVNVMQNFQDRWPGGYGRCRTLAEVRAVPTIPQDGRLVSRQFADGSWIALRVWQGKFVKAQAVALRDRTGTFRKCREFLVLDPDAAVGEPSLKTADDFRARHSEFVWQ